MPPVPQQQPRAGLITTVIIFALLFVIATIYAIYYGTNLDKMTKEKSDLKVQYDIIASPNSGSLVAQGSAQKAALDLMYEENVILQKVVLGPSPTTIPSAAHTAQMVKERLVADKAILTSGPSPAPDVIPSVNGNLPATIDALTIAYKEKFSEQAALIDQTNQFTAATNTHLEELQKKWQGVQDANNVLSTQLKQVQQHDAKTQQEKEDAIKAMQEENSKHFQESQDEKKKMQVHEDEQDKMITQKNQMIDALKSKLASLRVPVEPPIVRQPDGKILSVASNDTVYINIGQGDHVWPGLTFEVYNKHDGIPPIDNNLPNGEASIEITSIGPTSSQCRVVRTTLGQQINEGDPIVNLIYDRNVKYRFVVFGAFDLSTEGSPSLQDADIVKRLVTQWGGTLQPTITPDTDFLVIGREPEVPNYTPEELTNDVFKQNKKAEAEKALEDYQKILSEAKDLHVPIMSQNRFLYFVGYFDQARR